MGAILAALLLLAGAVIVLRTMRGRAARPITSWVAPAAPPSVAPEPAVSSSDTPAPVTLPEPVAWPAPAAWEPLPPTKYGDDGDSYNGS